MNLRALDHKLQTFLRSTNDSLKQKAGVKNILDSAKEDLDEFYKFERKVKYNKKKVMGCYWEYAGYIKTK